MVSILAATSFNDWWWMIPFYACTLGPVCGLYYCWARRRLDAWAGENQVRILRQQWRIFLRGPYDAIGKYTVFRVWAAEPTGGERVGWVRLGGFWSGLWSDESHVVWERDA